MDLRLGLESIHMWNLLMQMPTTQTRKYFTYPYPLSFFADFNTKKIKVGTYSYTFFPLQKYIQ